MRNHRGIAWKRNRVISRQSASPPVPGTCDSIFCHVSFPGFAPDFFRGEQNCEIINTDLELRWRGKKLCRYFAPDMFRDNLQKVKVQHSGKGEDIKERFLEFFSP